MNKINNGYWKDKGLCVSPFLSPNCTQCLARNGLPPLRREQSRVNECCHLHAQAASKGLSKQIALSGMNETPTMTGFVNEPLSI